MKAVVALLIALLVVVVSSRTIRWTAAGGNPLWENSNNWDCLCTPLPTDDVIIDLANIPGRVNVGAVPAFANSVTVGGVSTFPQSLALQNSLTIGAGGGKIMPNGVVNLNAGPNAPFYSAGVFDGSDHFTFLSGTLGGQFTFKNVNFSGSAQKNINGTTTVTGLVSIDLPVGAQGLITIAAGTFTITGSIKSYQTLLIAANPGAKFSVPGTVDFEGGVSTSLTLRGTTVINSLIVGGGNVILNDDVTISTASVASGATVTMIGATSVNRVFDDISGAGVLTIQGGTNTFHTMSNINTVNLAGGILLADTKTCTIGSLFQTGGIITGQATISANSATLANAVITNTPVTAQNLELKGFVSVNGGSLTVTVLGVVSFSSQVTLANGAVFAVGKTAKVSQAAELQILPSGTSNAPVFQNDGKWTSTSVLILDLLTKGQGGYELGSGASITLNGITFSGQSLLLTSANFTSIGASVTLGSIDGKGGIIKSQSDLFVVTGNMNVDTFVQENGVTNIATGNIANLDVQTGVFNVTGPGASVGALFWEGGQICSAPGSATILSATSTVVTGTQPKTLSSITLSSVSITISCGFQQCQLFTFDAKYTTSPSSLLI
jgi:hypothetical protein